MTAEVADVREPSASFPSPDIVLARAPGENFTVASALLGRATARHLRAIYGYARLVDELGDAAEGDRSLLLDGLENEVDRAFAGDARHPLMRELAQTIRACRLPRAPFLRLLEANRRDQVEPEYETYADLLSYCELSANPVGELVLHVFDAATAEQIALSDDVCTALQLVEHWQDVGEDAARGRIYLPAEDRAAFGVAREDLTASATSEPLRRLLAFESERAAQLLASGSELVSSLRGRARLAVAGYVGGGRAALHALAACGYDVLAVRARASRGRRAWLSLVSLRGAS
jgi:squalene synthase HpnC